MYCRLSRPGVAEAGAGEGAMPVGVAHPQEVPTAYHGQPDNRYSQQIHHDLQVPGLHKRSEEQWVQGSMNRGGLLVAAWQGYYAYLA